MLNSEKILLCVLIVSVVLACAGVGALLFRGISLSGETPQPETITIEGHDYFKLRGYGRNFTLTHKGNCRACGLMGAERNDH